MTYILACPQGRRQATSLAAMNIRAVIGVATLDYVVPPLGKPAVVTNPVGARFQPRDAAGRFTTYAELAQAINIDYAMTAFEHDQHDDLDQHDHW